MQADFFKDKPPETVLFYSNERYKLFTDGGFYTGRMGLKNPLTQKARGVDFIVKKANVLKSLFYYWDVPSHMFFKSGREFSEYNFNYPVFARPCPVVPRHGFVDSVICNNYNELNQVSRATFNVECDSELMIAKPINAQYSAIINNGVITFSSGNDGATSGRDCKYFYINEDPIGDALCISDTGIVEHGQVPFYELVFDSSKDETPTCYLVQIRSAPETPKSKDYIPSSVLVKNIVKAEGDLLEWEDKLTRLDPKTTIIDHIGGSLSSHYAIHAIVNRIPIFTTYLPEVGSYIEPTIESSSKITDEKREEFYKAFVTGFGGSKDIFKNMKYSRMKSEFVSYITKLGLATIHNFSAISSSGDYGVLGISLGMFCRACFAISFGEARFLMDCAKPSVSEQTKFYNIFNTYQNVGRANSYYKFFEFDIEKCLNAIELVQELFGEAPWNSGYGGDAWLGCTDGVIKLFNACLSRDIESSTKLFNVVINKHHNNGNYLNKVISQCDFDNASGNSSKYALSSLPIFVDILSTCWSCEGNFESYNESMRELYSYYDYKQTLKNDTNDANGDVAGVYMHVLYDNLMGRFYTNCIYVVKNNTQNIQNIEQDACKIFLKQRRYLPTKYGNGTGIFKLHSIPYWYVTEDGTCIISKKFISSFLSQK